MKPLSDCCGAPVDTDIMICSDCGEHCGIEPDEDSGDYDIVGVPKNL